MLRRIRPVRTVVATLLGGGVTGVAVFFLVRGDPAAGEVARQIESAVAGNAGYVTGFVGAAAALGYAFRDEDASGRWTTIVAVIVSAPLLLAATLATPLRVDLNPVQAAPVVAPVAALVGRWIAVRRASGGDVR